MDHDPQRRSREVRLREARTRFALRCIVVSTQSGIAALGRNYADDPPRRDRLQEATLARGRVLLDRFEASNAEMSSGTRSLLTDARVKLAD